VNLSLRLLDRNGKLWAQDDRELTGGIQRVGLAVPAGTPRGEYTLHLTLYRARDGKTLQPNNVLLTALQLAAPQTPNLNAITHRVTADFVNGMRLLGYHPPREPIAAGTPAPIVLYWTTTRALDAEYSVVVRINDRLGKTLSESRANIAQGAYPPSAWRVGELVRDPQMLTLFGDAGDGAYPIAIALESRDGASVRTSDGRDRIALGTVEVKNRAHYFGAPAATHRADYRWEDVARLVGYDVVGTRVVLYWQALGSPRVSYQGFVHLYDASDQLIAQRDQIFGAGAFPTTSWIKGECLVDAYDIALPADARGVYTIRIGMYNPFSGARLRAFDAANQLVGDIVTLSTRIETSGK
jgi:hypothetical protein